MVPLDIVTNAWLLSRIDRIIVVYVDHAYSKWIITVHGYVIPKLSPSSIRLYLFLVWQIFLIQKNLILG